MHRLFWIFMFLIGDTSDCSLNHLQERVPALGYVVENHRIGDVLLKQLRDIRKEKLIEIISPAEVVALKPLSDAAMNLTLSTTGSVTQNIDASLVVLSDGGRSLLMDKLYIRRKAYDYRQHAPGRKYFP